jgi:O-antigen/teichoic acid export membrane protein
VRLPNLTGEEIRRRAIVGVLMFTVRGLAIRASGFLGTLVLARLLTPRDFGLVGVGLIVLAFGRFVAGGGVAVALVRRPEPPADREIQSAFGCQLLIACVASAGVAAVALLSGPDGGVVALMALALPLYVLRVPPFIRIERQLDYGPVVRAEVAETVAYYAWAVATVAVGMGVWGMASASLVGPSAAALLAARVGPLHLMRPRLSWPVVRPILRFGLQFEAAGAVHLVREHGANLIIASVGGLAALGLWSLAVRIIQTASVVFQALWRVSYTALARLLETGERVSPLLQRGLEIATAGSALILVPLGATAPALVPALFGERWTEAAPILPWAAVGMMLAAPISVCGAGYLYAIGRAGSVLLAMGGSAVASWGSAALVLHLLGVDGLGLMWLTGSALEAAILGSQLARHTEIRVVPPLARGLAAALPALAVGWVVATELGPTLPSLVASALTCEAAFLALLAALAPGMFSMLRALPGKARAAPPKEEHAPRTAAVEAGGA